MSTESFIRNSSRRRVSGLEALGAGLGMLALLTLVQLGLAREVRRLNDELAALRPAEDGLNAALEMREQLNALKRRDVDNVKAAMIGLARRQKLYYEGSLALSEERRQLEKQAELLATHLAIDPAGRIRVMKGEQTAKEYAVEGLSCWEGVSGGGALKAPKAAVVTSKEFHAHPERGKVDLQDGRLLWTPPQTGSVERTAALGQYVIFTNTPLIIHLPSKDRKSHEAYRHCCLPLAASSAKKVYGSVFIGARLSIEAPKKP